MKRHYSIMPLALLAAMAAGQAGAQEAPVFELEQYRKALWMTARFYGAQRSGAGNNWLIAEHEPTQVADNLKGNLQAFVKGQDFVKDADGDYDLTGGWVDCGDNVKFGQTEYYAAYILGLGYSEFPNGYDDYYSQDYIGYRTASDYTWEGKAGKPNGIPDILDEVKYATDFCMKAMRDKNTFYYRVGDGDADHKIWCTSPLKATLSNSDGGEKDGSRPVGKATGGTTSMTALCGAALACMARNYKPFDGAYAAQCLEKAKVAYDYVMGHPFANSDGACLFYGNKPKPVPDVVILCMELYRTTGEATYLEKAKENSSWMATEAGYNHDFTLCYNNTEDLACYLMGMYGSGDEQQWAKTAMAFYVNLYKGSDYKLFKKNDGWGILRFPATQSFVLALNDKLNGETGVNPYSLRTIEYIMGSNGRKFSYIVGFGENFPHYPHHRNFYGLDNNDEGNLKPQEKFMQLGYMVGGTLDDGAYNDDEKAYTYSEGGIDYNTGLVCALGYLNSVLEPVNSNKFGHPTPKLGSDQNICGLDGIDLDSKVKADGKKVFTWFRDDAQVEQSTTASTFRATKAGTYRCQIDSAGEWQTDGTVKIVGELPDVSLPESITLCNPAEEQIDATVDVSVAYQWSRDGKDIAGATAAQLLVTAPGKYAVTISAKGCADKKGEVSVDSRLPDVVETAFSRADGYVVLHVKKDGDYEWYDVAEGGTPLDTGKAFTTTITKDTKFYVQDAGSVLFTAGPKASDFTGTAVNWGNISAKFTAKKAMQIKSLKVYAQSVYTPGQTTATAVLGNSGKETEFTSDPFDVTNGAGFYTVTFSNPITIEQAGDYSLEIKSGNFATGFFDKGPAYATYQNQGDVIEFTGASNGQASDGSMTGVADYEIQAGSGCGRATVYAKYDPQGAYADYAKADEAVATIYPNPTSDMVYISLPGEETVDIEVRTIGEQLVMRRKNLVSGSGINVAALPKGVYLLKIKGKTTNAVAKLIKE